jgi:creatinine deaminase
MEGRMLQPCRCSLCSAYAVCGHGSHPETSHGEAMERHIQEVLMEAARSEAEQSWQEGGIPVGAVLATEDGTIVARGHNRRIQSGDPTSHGETQCIRNAGRRRDWRQLTLVTTLSPCPMCSGTAVLLGFRRVLIGERRSYRGAEQWLEQAGIGVDCLDDPKCRELMERMQREKPELWREDIGLPPEPASPGM